MKRAALIAVLSLPLMAFRCGSDVRPAVEFPVPPELSVETRQPCPPADLVQGSLGDLAAKDAALAIEYAKCRERHATAVKAYGTVRQQLQKADTAASAATPR